jgi:hypothetical protein
LICKTWLKNQVDNGLTVITKTDLQTIVRMSKELAADPAVQRGVLNGYIEHSWFWKDKETGVWLKTRPDASPNDSLDFTDLKTCSSVSWSDLSRSIDKLGYDQQGALVGDACRNILGKDMQSFSLLFIESKPPCDVEFVTLKPNTLAIGDEANKIALRTFADCMDNRRWPGVRGGRAEPKWWERDDFAQKRATDRIKFYGINHE